MHRLIIYGLLAIGYLAFMGLIGSRIGAFIKRGDIGNDDDGGDE
jgi:hypothetical protein